MKTCITCKTEKPKAKFENHPTAKDGKRNQCASCRYKSRLNREPDYKDKARDWALGARYGITGADYDALLAKQNNKCAICDEETKLFIDHDHASGKVRGLLCLHCNSLLGFAKDSPYRLERASAYLHALGESDLLDDAEQLVLAVVD